MRRGLSGSLLCLLASAGLALAQPPSGTCCPAGDGGPGSFTLASLCDWWSPCSSCDGGYVGDPGWELRVRAEYLLWWAKDGPLDTPLVTNGRGTSVGILGQAGTRVLFGGDDLDYGEYSGGRGTFDLWLDQCQTYGIQGSTMLFGQRGDEFDVTGNAVNGLLLARPFLNANTGAEDAQLISAPGAFAGTIRIGASSQLWGAEGNVLLRLYEDCACRVELLGGARYLQLDEAIEIFERIDVLQGGLAGFVGTPLLAGDRLNLWDSFDVRNEFYGGQVGVQARYEYCNYVAQFSGKLAMGSSRELASIIGATSISITQNASGALLAQPTNIARYERNEFAVVPELGIKLGCVYKNALYLTLGWDFLYWSEVVRPGDQIDRVVNTTQVPKSLAFNDPRIGPARPINDFPSSSFWAHGLTVAAEFRY